jgi:hypothetical protein
MGAMADAMLAYAQPLLDETDGSPEAMKKAFDLAMLCWVMALSPESQREEGIAELRKGMAIDDSEFADFRKTVIEPMICRYHEMFPASSQLDSLPWGAVASRRGKSSRKQWIDLDFGEHSVEIIQPEPEKFPGTGRNAPCPCGSGKKYKCCCGVASRKRFG